MSKKQEFVNMADLSSSLHCQYGNDADITMSNPVNDVRIGWRDSMYVNVDNNCVGMCATDYEKE